MFHTEWTEKEDMISRFSVSSWPWFILFIGYKSEMSQMRTVLSCDADTIFFPSGLNAAE